MPLPPSGGQWPPQHIAPAYDRMATWSAWYSGDPEELSDVYGAQPPGGSGASEFSFDYSRSGSGSASVRDRYFWGQPPVPGAERNRLHVPLPSDLAVISSDMLFADPPAFKCENPDTQSHLDAVRETSAMDSLLLSAAETAAALTGVYLRVVWDTALRPGPFLDAVHPDAAVPEFRYGFLTAVTFWYTVVVDSGGHGSASTVYRHLERHEPGVILHGLYKGDADKLGDQVDLGTLTQTRAYEPAVKTAKDTMTAVYVPNMLPSRLWRRSPSCAPLGRSDYSGVEPFFDKLDEVYTSWCRDIRLGKARVFVPEEYLDSGGPGKGASFDAEREFFVAIQGLGAASAEGKMQLVESQFAIRVEEHERTCNNFVRQIIRSTGYSAQSLGETGDVAVTATEINSRERRTLVTRAKKIGHWRRGLESILEALLRVDATVFGSGVSPGRPRVEFPSVVKEQPLTVAQTIKTLDEAGAASTEVKVRMAHPDWPDERVAAEVVAIREASAEVPEMEPVPMGVEE